MRYLTKNLKSDILYCCDLGNNGNFTQTKESPSCFNASYMDIWLNHVLHVVHGVSCSSNTNTYVNINADPNDKVIHAKINMPFPIW